MGEKTASQVQDVVVAGSQSSNFLLPKENKSPRAGVPQTYNGGPMLRLRPTKQSLERLLPFLLVCRDRRWREGGMVVPHTHRVEVKCYCMSDPCGPPLQLLGVEKLQVDPVPASPPPHSAPIRLYYCISGNSSQNKPCPIVMIVLISAA